MGAVVTYCRRLFHSGMVSSSFFCMVHHMRVNKYKTNHSHFFRGGLGGGVMWEQAKEIFQLVPLTSDLP